MRKLLKVSLVVLVIAGAGYAVRQYVPADKQPAWLGQAEAALTEASGWLGQASASTATSRYMTATVERGDVRQTVTTTGTLHALVTVEVGTQLSGQIDRLFADFNDEVTKDQPLAQLDRKSFEARLAEARAATAMAEANVDIQRARLERARIEIIDAEAQRAVLQARLDSAKVRLEAAESALARSETLRERGTVSSTQVEDAQATRDGAAASVREAEAIATAHEHSVEGARVDLQRSEAELANALASVPQKKAVERAAEIDLERTTIRSPVDGVVVGRNINEGQTVAASLEAPTLFTIAGDLQQMEIYARVDESDIGKIKMGQKAVFTVDAHPGRRFLAVVSGVRKAPQVIQNVVTYTVVLATANHDALLLPGMTATVRITVAEATSVLKMPMAALRFSPGAETAATAPEPQEIEEGRPALVWLATSEGDPTPVPVGLGQDDGAHAAILDGSLSEGDQIIVGEIMEAADRQLFGIRFGF